MDPFQLAQIGKTSVNVTRLGLGGAPLGNLLQPVPQQQAIAAIRGAYQLGIRYMDTAPLYGYGLSETRFGEALAGLPRDSFVISTKVGRLLKPSDPSRSQAGQFRDTPPLEPVFNFSRDAVLRSLEESLKRLRMDHVEIALIHDPDNHWEQAINEAYPTLAELRSQGVVKAIGAGMNQWQMLARFAQEGDFDCFLLAGRYTLLDHSALPEFLPLCVQKGISIIIGGPYNSGILADPKEGATFNYTPAPAHLLQRAQQLKAVCQRHGVPLRAAALQFVLAHPAVATVIPGARSLDEVKDNVAMVQHPIPAQLWEELRHQGLVPPEAPTPKG